MNRLRVGVLGMGTIGATHAAALRELAAEAVVTAFSGSSAPSARAVGWPEAVRVEPAALLGRDDVDIVAICTPSHQHGVQVLAALEANKHVVVEKPFTLDVAQAERICALAQRRHLQVSVISQRRFEPQHQLVHEMLQSGALGTLRLARAHVHWWRDEAYYQAAPWRGLSSQGGSALDNQGVHSVDLLRWLAGPVAVVSAQSATLAHDVEAPDTVVATLQFASGALGVLSISTATPPGFPATIALNFDRGALELGDNAILGWDHETPCPASTVPPRRASGAERAMGIGLHGHVDQWRDVLAAVREHRPSSIDAADAVQTVRLSAAIAQAARTGRHVRPDQLE